MELKSKCPDCYGFCNFGEYPNCKPSVVKEFEDECFEDNICDFCKEKKELSEVKIDEGERVMLCEDCKINQKETNE